MGVGEVKIAILKEAITVYLELTVFDSKFIGYPLFKQQTESTKQITTNSDRNKHQLLNLFLTFSSALGQLLDNQNHA